MKTIALSEIPASWDEVTPEWMTDAVAPHHPGAHVSKVEVADVTQGNNRRVRFRLNYDAGTGPEYLFAKSEGNFREMHAKNGNLFNEPALFASGVSLPLPHPKSYKVIMDRTGLDYVVVMEDITLRGAKPLDTLVTLSPAQAATGVEGLARMHGQYWNLSAGHAQLSWLLDWAPSDGFRTTIAPAVGRGLAKAAGKLPPALDAYDAEAIVALMERAMISFTTGAQTLLHGDAHIGNTFLLPNGEIGFLDWQVARRGNWSQDLGYFFVSALSIEDRRAHEAELLELYAERLGLPAAQRPAPDEIRQRYAASMAFALPVWLATYSAGVTQAEEGSLTLCRRYTQAFLDLDTPAALAALGV